jgi:4-hydroxy-tetrahydrodipicolinate synthase
MSNHPLSGVYAAAVTPLNKDDSIAFDQIPEFLGFLAKRGCHGALLLGTTGEGPSFSINEREKIYKAATEVKEVFPDFRLLAGTGTPSLEETVLLTKSAFDLGFEGAVVLPPYYYHQATEEGLTQWFFRILKEAVPEDRYLFGYHFPAQAGVPIPEGVITRLREAFPRQFAGLKDSTKNAEHTFHLGSSLDKNMVALIGNDKLFLKSLQAGGSGCITAMCNLHSPTSRKIWDSYQNGYMDFEAQEFILTKRKILDNFQPFASTIKRLLHMQFGFPDWKVRPPLTPLTELQTEMLIKEMLD